MPTTTASDVPAFRYRRANSSRIVPLLCYGRPLTEARKWNLLIVRSAPPDSLFDKKFTQMIHGWLSRRLARILRGSLQNT